MASLKTGGDLSKLDPSQVKELYNRGAFLIIRNMPTGTEFGIDYGSWSVGEKFEGLKMIPPGNHYVFYSAVSKQGNIASRIGFFHDFTPQEVVVKEYDALQEMLLDSNGHVPDKDGLKALDSSLAPYPYQHYQKWCSLTTHITMTTVTRIQPRCINIYSATPLLHNPNAAADVETAVSVEEKLDANFIQDDDIIMNKLDTKKDMKGLSPKEITQFYMDPSAHIDKLIAQTGTESELLGELEMAFVVFLLGHVYTAFEHWKQLVGVICRGRQSLHDRPSFYKDFIRTLHYHLKETPSDFFVDIVSRNNFLTSTLKVFFETVREELDLEVELMERATKFRSYLEKRFEWDFGYDEDDAPVVVEM